MVSSVISLLIGFIIPMGKVSEGARIKAGLERGSIKARLLETLISDLIYTPVITIAMIAIVRAMVPEQALESMPPFGIMFIRSLLMCFVAGFVLIFLLMPIFRNMAFKKYDIPLGPVGGR